MVWCYEVRSGCVVCGAMRSGLAVWCGAMRSGLAVWCVVLLGQAWLCGVVL